MTDDTETEISEEYDGRTITIDTGFYCVEVYGEPGDPFADVLEAAEHAADRAKEDVEQMDDQLDGDDIHYR